MCVSDAECRFDPHYCSVSTRLVTIASACHHCIKLTTCWLAGAVIAAGQCIASATNHETAMAQDDFLGQKVDSAS